MNKKSRQIALFLFSALVMGSAGGQAYAQTVSNTNLPPIVYIVLDTSGSMNNAFGGNNNTRLTKALGEIIGASDNIDEEGKLVRATSSDKNASFELPFSQWNCGDDMTSCGYQITMKTIKGNSGIAKPNITQTMINAKNFDSGYSSDGVIQAYQKVVKFGFAAMAVGSGGSSAGKDSAIKQAASLAGGRTEDTILRFTLIWGHRASDQSTSDPDSHVSINNGTRGGDNYIYYSHKYAHGGTLDVDNTNPMNRTDQYAVCISKDDSQFYKCQDLPSDKIQQKIGVENIYWKDNSALNDGDTFRYFIQPYRYGSTDKGFTAEIAYKDKNGCDNTYTFDYSANIPSGYTYYNDQNYGFPIATVKYHKNADGTYYFTMDEASIGKSNYNAYHKDLTTSGNFTHEQSGGPGEPKYIYGLEQVTQGDITYGRNLQGLPYKVTKDCTYDIGMWNSDPKADAPLVYPTVSDSEDDIKASNDSLVRSVRTYTATSATPVGEVLADLYYMFGGDGTIDEGLIKQQFSKIEDPKEDEYYACRSKAVIFISDGEPNGSGVKEDSPEKHGHSKHVWHDAAWLSKIGIKVYVIGYAEFTTIDKNGAIVPQDPRDEKTAAYTLNRMAWKGGTCRDPRSNQIISPSDEGAYNDMVNSDALDVYGRSCFYNASDSTALRTAIVTALSDMLNDTVSKTKIATTTALSTKNNTTSSGTNKVYHNGYYNVYSGYEITLGHIRKTHLYRDAYVCNSKDSSDDPNCKAGNFCRDSKQYRDLAKRLSCKISDCKTWVLNETTNRFEAADDKAALSAAGYTAPPTPCAPVASSGDPNDYSVSNTCLTSRYIFAGDYHEDGARYKINPDIAPISKTDALHSTRNSIAGWINSGRASGVDMHYLDRAENDLSVSCSHDMANTDSEYLKDISNYRNTANYILSPYNCVTDFDCGVVNGKTRRCDLGRCVDSDIFKNTMVSCHVDANGKKCVGGYLRASGVECTNHENCQERGAGFVCHAGNCVPGTIPKCDIRSFIASQPLGTIEYASPVVVEPPTRSYRSIEYRKFSKEYWDRDTLLMVGANDGMLHAFVLGDNAGSGNDGLTSAYTSGKYDVNSLLPSGSTDKLKIKEGDELWGFIPKTIMPNLYKLTEFGAQTHVNVAPVVADVPIPTPSTDPKAINWRTVMVGGLRDGGRGYYALDITNPADPKILWEIDNQWQTGENSLEYNSPYNDEPVTAAMVKENKDSGKYPFLQMGYTYTEPLITNMVIGDKLEPVAVLPGGLSKNNDESGKTMYIVRLFPEKSKDLLVKTFYFKNEMTGAPAVYPNAFNTVAQHIYVGDNKGALYRLSVKDADLSKWGDKDADDYETPVFDPEAHKTTLGGESFEKITHRPAVALFKTLSGYPVIQVTVGTGSNDNFNVNSKDKNYVANFYDAYDGSSTSNSGYTLNLEGVGTEPSMFVFTSDPNRSSAPQDIISDNQKFSIYYADPKTKALFAKRQKMTGAPIIYNFDAYFPTFIADENSSEKCSTGNAAIYRIKSSLSADARSHAVLKSDDVQNYGNKTTPFVNESFITLGSGTKIYGLTITNQLYCADDSGRGKFAAPQLVAQTNTDASSLASDSSSNLAASSGATIKSFAMNLDAIAPTTVPVKWASVYE